MNSGGILEELDTKRRKIGLTEAELYIYNDLLERGEPDLTTIWPEDPLIRWLVEKYIVFVKAVVGTDLFHTQINFSGRVLNSFVLGLGETITALFARQCCVGNTVVLNTNGRYIDIKDMVEGEFGDVVGLDEIMQSASPGKIYKFHKNGIKKVYRVITESGFEIECTDNHPFWVRQGKVRNVIIADWKLLKNIKRNRTIAVYKYVPVFGDYLQSEHKLKALGYFHGYHTDDLEYCSFYRIDEAEQILESFNDRMIKSGSKTGVISKDSNCLKWVTSQCQSDGKFPEWAEQLPKEQLRLLLSRYWGEHIEVRKLHRRGYGNLDLAPEHEHDVKIRGVKPFLYQMKLLLLKFGVRSKLRPTDESLYALWINNYEMPRFLYEIQPYRVKNLHPPKRISTYNRSIDWEKIIAIDYVGEKETYDVSVQIECTNNQQYLGLGVRKKIYNNLFENGIVCHNSGKTQNMAWLMTYLASVLPELARMERNKIAAKQMKEIERLHKMWDNGFWCGIYGPAKRQSGETYERLKDTMNKKTLEMLGQTSETSNGELFTLAPNGSKIGAFSASENSSIESQSWKGVVLEEAQDIGERQIVKSILPMLSFYNGTPIYIGTPTDHDCSFYEAITLNKASNPANHLEYDYRHICYQHRPYFLWVVKQIQEHGWDSDFIKMSYRILWVFEHGQFITPELFRACAYPDSKLEVGMLFKSAYPKYIGIDVAKSPCRTVAAVVAVVDKKRIVLDWLPFSGEDYKVQAQFISAWVGGMNNVRSIYVDSTSKDGDSMTERLIENISNVRVVPIKYSPQTKNDMYRCFDSCIRGDNGKSDFYYPYGKKTRQERKFLDFRSEMLALRKYYRGGLMVCEKPEKRNAFDDFCDGTCQAVYASYQESASAMIVESRRTDTKAYAERKFANTRHFKGGRR